MAKINTQKKTVTVPHPNFPELKVHANVLEPVEAMDLFSGFQEYQRVVAVQDSKGNIVRNEDGNLETSTLTSLPAAAILSILQRYVIGWEGMEDENGKAIPFKVENLKFLFSKELNIRSTDDKGKPSVQSFADYIQAEVNKVQEEESEKELDELPKSKTSPKLR